MAQLQSTFRTAHAPSECQLKLTARLQINPTSAHARAESYCVRHSDSQKMRIGVADRDRVLAAKEYSSLNWAEAHGNQP
jgi:hypothetical protein